MESLQMTLVFICFFLDYKTLAENSNDLLLHRIQNLEKQLDLHLKTMKSEFNRDINNGHKRNTDTDQLRQVQASTRDLSLDALLALSSDVRSLISTVESMQNQISEVDKKVSDLSKCGEVPTTTVPSTPVFTATPSSVGRVRLVGGSDHSGTVEINVEGQWGTICDDNWDPQDANVVCRMLGFSGAETVLSEAHFGEGTGDILLDGTNCMGNESSIFDCPHYGVGIHDCSHPEDAGVICSNGGETTPIQTTTLIPTSTPTSFPISYRLVDGPNSYAGRVEVFYNGEWGTVCDDGFDERETLVLCNHLGIRGGTPTFYEGSFYGSGSGPIHMDDLECVGFESSLEFCNFRDWGVHNCGHGEDVGVDCYSNSSSGTTGYTTTTTEAPVLQTTLVDGSNGTSGRVEVYHDGVWGTVCDDDFGDEEAAVVCRSLGLRGGKAHKEAAYGQGIGPIWMDDVHCTGKESSLGGCMFSGWNSSNCGHDEDVAVECESASTHPNRIRLVEGAGPWEGRVEVYIDNEWGTVCDYDWDDREAQVVCRMLGLSGGEAYSGSKYGPGSSTVKLASYGCTGEESTLFNCSFWDSRVITYCGHDNDAGVECLRPLKIDDVYLVGGESENVGRVEITINGVTGTICDDHFDDKATAVLCRMLGYTHGGEFYIEARYGEGSGQVVLDDVKCNGDENSLAECSHREPLTSNCEHDEDVSVKCFSEVVTGIGNNVSIPLTTPNYVNLSYFEEPHFNESGFTTVP